MRKLITILTILVLGFVASAEHFVTYNVTYNYRMGKYVFTDSTRVEVVPSLRYKENKETVDWIKDHQYDCYIDEIVDEDSEAKDIAIVSKLDKLGGYDIAWPENSNTDVIIYFKEGGEWHKLTRVDEPVILTDK